MDTVNVVLPVELVKKLIKPWYLIKQLEAKEIRSACREALDARTS